MPLSLCFPDFNLPSHSYVDDQVGNPRQVCLPTEKCISHHTYILSHSYVIGLEAGVQPTIRIKFGRSATIDQMPLPSTPA